MEPTTLACPIRSTRVSLETDNRRGPVHGRYDVTYHIYDALFAPTVRTLPDGRLLADFSEIVGRLAESAESNAECSRWVITLKKGILSHAGNELTSDDVVWSYQRVFASRGVGMWRISTLAGVPPADGIRALDRYRVEFTIEGANPVFPRFLCYPTGAIVDSTEASKHATGDDPWAGEYLTRNACGFGAFDVRHWDEERLDLKPRKEFWAGTPPIDGVIFRAASREERLQLFEEGELNLVGGLWPDEVRRLMQVPGTKLALGKTNHATIEMDHNRPPFSDRGVREAVLRTIPYQRIIDEAYEGLAEPQRGIYQPITPEYSEDGWIYTPDLERSRELVWAAGARGTEVTFVLGRTSESPKIGALVAEALDEIGLKLRVIEMDELRPDEPPEMYLREDCSHGIADPHYDLGIDFAAPRDMPYRFFPGRRLTPRLREIRHAPAEAQAGMYRETQRELLADAICVPLAGHSFPIAYNENIDPWFMSPDYLPFSHLLFSAHRW